MMIDCHENLIKYHMYFESYLEILQIKSERENQKKLFRFF